MYDERNPFNSIRTNLKVTIKKFVVVNRKSEYDRLPSSAKDGDRETCVSVLRSRLSDWSSVPRITMTDSVR